ncbi:hypothetical protein COW91_00670 [Candidatus Nomurabacteria bacterium CG22_combo_CG10-13_8_21_14_all_32_8]|uniref:Uncharacterized protein n=2 Tax=Candidatus Nomuraibacteriota TaxID=1752729 RepID=A0A2H0CHD1_9BACT|nr:MAG: hypothetical protein COW91_00670 [Candidatus Nomurabacteria bacterium CG22_combo_CG10-13_8_21_14_all_32_8]
MDITNKNNSFIDKIFLNKWTPVIIIIIIGFLIYGRTLFFNFTYLDDNVLILDNQYFLSKITNIFQSFLADVFHLFNSSAFYYRPMLTISFIFDYQIGGAYPFIYHFTNISLHILVSFLIFIFFKKLDYKKELAFLFSIIFLVHPVLTQAVAWIPGRNDSLLAVFILSSFIFFIKYLKEEKIKNLFLGLLFFSLAIFTKESALSILFLMIFYSCFIYKEKKLFIKNLYFFIGLFGIVTIWAIIRNIVLLGSIPITPTIIIRSIYSNFLAIPQFIGKIFFPFNLSVLPIIKDTTFIYGTIAIILLIILFILIKKKRWNFILFGFMWFFAFLLPAFIRPYGNIIADFLEHRLYVPIIGIFIFLLETDFVGKIDFKNKKTLILIGSLIFLFSIINIIHNGNFSDKLSFWENAAQTSPNHPLAHRNLGAMQYLNKDMENAEKESKIALELNPEEQMAHNNLGLIYASQNKLKEAEEEYKKELENNPYYDNAYFNLGLLYWNQEKYDDAVNSWKKTLELNPNYIDAFNALMIYNYEQKNYEEMTIYANELYKRGIQIPPEIIQIIQNQN